MSAGEASQLMGSQTTTASPAITISFQLRTLSPKAAQESTRGVTTGTRRAFLLGNQTRQQPGSRLGSGKLVC